jgi:hypothetical protein
MSSSGDEKQNVAYQAESDLNSYQAKTGTGKTSSSDESGVDSTVESRFPGSEVKYGDDLVTNAGYNRHIPPEGGDLDARGRYLETCYYGSLLANNF